MMLLIEQAKAGSIAIAPNERKHALTNINLRRTSGLLVSECILLYLLCCKEIRFYQAAEHISGLVVGGPLRLRHPLIWEFK